MNYTVVFDISDTGYKSGTFLGIGLVLLMVSALLILARQGFGLRKGGRARVWLALLFFAILWTSVVFVSTYRDYRSVLRARSEGRAAVVEGRVSRFVPMPVSGHAMESFCVKDKCFYYSDYNDTIGFNNTSTLGGPIRAGLPVRVTYVGNTIIRLEIGSSAAQRHDASMVIVR